MGPMEYLKGDLKVSEKWMQEQNNATVLRRPPRKPSDNGYIPFPSSAFPTHPPHPLLSTPILAFKYSLNYFHKSHYFHSPFLSIPHFTSFRFDSMLFRFILFSESYVLWIHFVDWFYFNFSLFFYTNGVSLIIIIHKFLILYTWWIQGYEIQLVVFFS